MCSAFKSTTSPSKTRPAFQPLIKSAPPQEITHFKNNELIKNSIIQIDKLNLVISLRKLFA